jgi:hypothetical protein
MKKFFHRTQIFRFLDRLNMSLGVGDLQVILRRIRHGKLLK